MDNKKRMAQLDAGLKVLEAVRPLFDAIDAMFKVEVDTKEGTWPGGDQLYELTEDDEFHDAVEQLVQHLGNQLLAMQGSVPSPVLLQYARRVGAFIEYNTDNEVVPDEHDWR